MLLWIDDNRRITATNDILSHKEAQAWCSDCCIWLEDPVFPVIEEIPGKRIIYTLNEDNQIIAEYEEIETPEISQLDRIETALQKSQEDLRNEGAATVAAPLKSAGAAMAIAMAQAGIEVPPGAGAFAENWPEWQADGATAEANSLWRYQGIGYQARIAIQKIEAYAPDRAVNSFAVRPIPDKKGIYPAVLNMDVSVGMAVRDTEDGNVYECYANPITSLQWQPHELPASFRLKS